MDELQEKIINKITESLNQVLEQDMSFENLDVLYKLVDIHKDIYNEKYWKEKSECMRYDGYSRYSGYDRGRYNDYGRMRYRGDEHIDRMYNNYSRYEDGRNDYNRGNYNAKEDTLKSLKYMLESACDFFEMLKSEANSPEEMQMIREYTQKISE